MADKPSRASVRLSNRATNNRTTRPEDGMMAGGGVKGGPRRVTSSDIQGVQNLIERCLQLYMTQRVRGGAQRGAACSPTTGPSRGGRMHAGSRTRGAGHIAALFCPPQDVVHTLQSQAKIEPSFTSLVWQKLEEQNPDFFKAYYLRCAAPRQHAARDAHWACLCAQRVRSAPSHAAPCPLRAPPRRLKLKDQVVMFNHLVEQQLQMMQKLQNSWMQVGPALMGGRAPSGLMMQGMQPPPAPPQNLLFPTHNASHMAGGGGSGSGNASAGGGHMGGHMGGGSGAHHVPPSGPHSHTSALPLLGALDGGRGGPTNAVGSLGSHAASHAAPAHASHDHLLGAGDPDALIGLGGMADGGGEANLSSMMAGSADDLIDHLDGLGGMMLSMHAQPSGMGPHGPPPCTPFSYLDLGMGGRGGKKHEGAAGGAHVMGVDALHGQGGSGGAAVGHHPHDDADAVMGQAMAGLVDTGGLAGFTGDLHTGMGAVPRTFSLGDMPKPLDFGGSDLLLDDMQR